MATPVVAVAKNEGSWAENEQGLGLGLRLRLRLWSGLAQNQCAAHRYRFLTPIHVKWGDPRSNRLKVFGIVAMPVVAVAKNERKWADNEQGLGLRLGLRFWLGLVQNQCSTPLSVF